VYAGDPERLSLRAAFPTIHEFEAKYGSVLRGAMKSLPAKGTPRPAMCSFRDGMEALPQALGVRLGDALQTETTVTGIRRGKTDGNSWFELDVIYQDHYETLMASAVIVATSANAASEILGSVSETFAAPFARIEYAPVAVVAAGYRRDQLQREANGFGFLVPRSEGLRVLGTVWNSSLFPGRVPEGMVCFTSFAGGATDPKFCELSADEIAEAVGAEVGHILGITGKPVTRMVQCYAHALPQYNLGHAETVAALAAATASVPGLFLTGNYLSGISVGACVEQANRTAEAARVYLTSIGIAGVGAVART
jgi:oxygen-dependent protoporphyrinogen oxidase